MLGSKLTIVEFLVCCNVVLAANSRFRDISVGKVTIIHTLIRSHTDDVVWLAIRYPRSVKLPKISRRLRHVSVKLPKRAEGRALRKKMRPRSIRQKKIQNPDDAFILSSKLFVHLFTKLKSQLRYSTHFIPFKKLYV